MPKTTSDEAPVLVEPWGETITRIVLNRPSAMNAYTTAICEALTAAVDAYVRDDTQRVLVLTGAGRGFCAGGDVSGNDAHRADLMASQLSHGREMRDGMHRVIRALHDCDKPTLAAINGPAVAGGLTLALACDLRIAARSAKLGDTSGRFGLLPDEGGAWYFPRAMGLDRALKMTLLAETYDAETALALGLVTEVVDDADLDQRVRTLAEALSERAPLAVRLAKSMAVKAQSQTLEAALRDAQLAVMIANPSEDVREGVEAFFQRRKPNFTGR